MARILVTGAEGFTGRYLCTELSAHGHEVLGLVRHTGSFIAGAQEQLGCDLLDPEAVRAAVRAARPSHVIHLAGIALVAHDDVEAIYRTNLIGTRHLLAALATSDATPRGVLLASSANIYGNTKEGTIDESVAPSPTNDYAVSKLAMEYMAATWKDRLPAFIVRPFNYTGVGQSEEFLLPKIIAHFQRRAPILELGNLDVERDFSDVRTVVRCYRLLLEANPVGEVFNICSGQATSLHAILQMVGDLAGYTPEIRVNPAFVRSNEVRRLIGSKARLEACIGQINGPSLPETLAWMLRA